MQKDFITVTPDSGTGSKTVTVNAPLNLGGIRSTQITVSGGGLSKTILVSQEGRQLEADLSGNIRFRNTTSSQIYSRFYLSLVDNNLNQEIGIMTRINPMSPGEIQNERTEGQVYWNGIQNFYPNKAIITISSGKRERINIQINGMEIINGTYTESTEIPIPMVFSIEDGSVIEVSGEVVYT